MCRREKRPRAFTLVELLVVIGTIAALVAILLPSLKSAREQARRAACGAHLHQVTIATEAYTLDNNALPTMNRQGYDINYRRIMGEYRRVEINGFGPETWPEYLHSKNFWTGAPFRGLLFQVDIFPGMNETDFGKWRNLGLLWVDRAISDPKGLFCPSQRNPFYAWRTPLNPWPPKFETARRPDQTNWANHTESSYERRLGLTGVPWDRISPRTALYTDRLVADNDSTGCTDTQVIERTHKDGVNIAYRDGHVAYLRDKRFTTWMPEDACSMYEAYEDLLGLYDWMDRQFNR